MGILGRMFAAGLAALAGCYSPAVRDCTVSCEAPGDCVSGQICGSDGFCAAPRMAGRCGAMAMIDAGSPLDAAPPDGSSLVSLHVQIMGVGSVLVAGHGICSSAGSQRGDCMYELPANVSQTVFATPIQLDQVFTSWTSLICGGQNASCTFTPVAATTIVAKFDHR
jgi:hypothetical protein